MQIPCCVAQWTIWHFCPHTERALLIIYCPTIVNYGHGLGKNQMPLEWIGLDWSGLDWVGVDWSEVISGWEHFPFFLLGRFSLGFRTSWATFHMRRDRRRLHFTSDSDSDSDSDSVWVWFWFWFSVWFRFRRC